MIFVVAGMDQKVNLQATLASASAYSVPLIGDRGGISPHHPITCQTTLRLEEDGTLACDHTSAPADDVRTQRVLDGSVAILLLELASRL